jgi:transcriptional regulator with XRE-family HTH domain
MNNNKIEFDKNIYNTIRKNIRKYRKEKGMTSMQLAEMVDLSHDFIRQIQSDKTAYNFSVDTFYKVSVALGVSLDDLIKKSYDKETFEKNK